MKALSAAHRKDRSMQRFRKRPVAVEAIRLVDDDDLMTLYRANAPVSGLERAPDGRLTAVELRTLEGPLKARVGDWIIRGIKGEFYPCKPDVFEATYEPEPGEVST